MITKTVLQVCDVNGGEVSDSHIDAAKRSLRRELEALNVVDVADLYESSPIGSKSLDTSTLGQLSLSLIGSGGVAVVIIATLKDWLIRNKRFKIRVKVGDKEIEIDAASKSEIPPHMTDALLELLSKATG